MKFDSILFDHIKSSGYIGEQLSETALSKAQLNVTDQQLVSKLTKLEASSSRFNRLLLASYFVLLAVVLGGAYFAEAGFQCKLMTTLAGSLSVLALAFNRITMNNLGSRILLAVLPNLEPSQIADVVKDCYFRSGKN